MRSAVQDAGRDESVDAFARVTEIASQDRFVVFAEGGCGELEFIGKPGKAQWESGDLEFTKYAIGDLADGATRAQMRMLHGLADGENRRDRHAPRAHRVDRGFVARHRREPILD